MTRNCGNRGNRAWMAGTDTIEAKTKVTVKFDKTHSLRQVSHMFFLSVLISSIWNSVSQTFLFHRPLFTLDTSFSPPKPDKATQGSKFKYFYLKKVLNSWTKPLTSWTKQLYYDADITFRIFVKITPRATEPELGILPGAAAGGEIKNQEPELNSVQNLGPELEPWPFER